jgi:uncharacterized protein
MNTEQPNRVQPGHAAGQAILPAPRAGGDHRGQDLRFAVAPAAGLRAAFRPRRIRAAWSFALLGFSLSSCSLPQPQSDPTRYYLLAGSSNDASPVASNAPALHVRPIELASYLRGRPLMIRKGNNEVEFREYARWGEPLELGIARVLRDELLGRGAASSVGTSGLRATSRPYDFELTIRVLACEGTVDGNVLFRARWDLAPVGDNAAPVAHGDFRPTDLKWNGKDDSALAARLSDAVSGLAAEIAAALKK